MIRERRLVIPSDRQRADRDNLVTQHLGLANSIAGRYTNRGESYDDLFQVASVALVLAADRFDPEVGASFATFATRTIIGEIKRHFRDRGWLVRPPRQVQELYVQLDVTVAKLSQELGRSPTIKEIAETSGHTIEDVLKAISAGGAYRGISLDVLNNDSGEVADDVAYWSDAETNGASDDLLTDYLSVLPLRDRRILHLRFVKQWTQSAIAIELGMSQMHVSRIIRSSLEELRRIHTQRSN